jgi:two-component system LytT family sensor kinase
VHPRLRYFAISLLIASVPIALLVLTTRGPRESGRPPDPLGQTLVSGAVFWYPWVIAAALVDRRVRQSRASNRRERLRAIAGHLPLLLAFWACHGAALTATTIAYYPNEAAHFWRFMRDQLLPDTLLYAALASGFTIAESRRRQTEVAERLRAEVAEARLDALRQQLNPHFLFNTLNHIVVQLRGRDIDPALRMLLALSDLLRDVLRERTQLIPLRDEVRMVERYLEIERERFGDRLLAEVTFEPRALDGLVPSLLLQPLLENAMRHGVSTGDGRCRLWLKIRAEHERLLIEVRDAGPGLGSDQSPGTGIGVKNTAERLKYLYGADHSFQLRTPEGGGLLVAIDVPFRRS